MLTLDITDIHSDTLKNKLKRLGLKNSRTSSTEFQEHLNILVEQVKKAPNEDEVRSRIKDFLVNTGATSSQNIVLEENRVDVSLRSIDGKSTVCLIEVKHPSNTEMLKTSDGNRKALHELIWYFLNEVYRDGDVYNRNLESLIATDGMQWFLFSPKDFYRLFGEGPFAKEYNEFKKANYGNDSEAFYEKTKTYLSKNNVTIPCVYFDLNDLDGRNMGTIKGVLSQQFLVGGTKEKDSNAINSKFYDELLHIIGLEERTENKKLIIGRKEEKKRDDGSLLELAINKLNDKYPFEGTVLYDRLTDYGNDQEEQIFNVALELCLMWVNRILFLKLLETSLLTYKNSNKPFLNTSTIHDFQDLYQLFFKVMGTPVKSRETSLQQKFSQVPYLNSSLFELSLFENASLIISNLASDKDLPLFSGTILKNAKKSKVKYHTLDYLLNFLNAYKFGDDEDSTINASVLGKVFEKINGYKDGSVYTPGYITAYMCKDSINAAVLAKFSSYFKHQINSIDELRYNINYERLNELIAVFDSVTLCDISVGSGHYLVSALNYFLYLKWSLGLFLDSEKNDLRRFLFELKDDSLKVYRGASEIRYDHNNRESQLLQEALFEEKKRLLENNLFGVDINLNSVNICRLRLWIELLKNAYYKAPNYEELRTLPNVDLNIKCGDSLLSKIPVIIGGNIDISGTHISETQIKNYKNLAKNFKNTDDKVAKKKLNDSIKKLKKSIQGEYMKYLELSEEFREKNKEIDKNDSYRHALEWMFEFPELVNSKGRFEGFDIVIGNPPYINLGKVDNAKLYGSMIQNKKNVPVYSTFCKGGDIYTLFVERACALAGTNGVVSYIMPNKWMSTDYGKRLRNFALENGIDRIVDFGDYQVFPNVTTYTCIVSKYGKENKKRIEIANVSKPEDLANTAFETFKNEWLSDKAWITSSVAENRLMAKLEVSCSTLKDVVEEPSRGVVTGLTEAFIINEATKNKLIKENANAQEVIFPVLQGKDIDAWDVPMVESYLIGTFPSKKINIDDYPSVRDYLLSFGMEKLEQTGAKHTINGETIESRKKTHNKWFETQDSIAYYEEFSKSKIMYQTIAVQPCFIYDEKGFYCNNSMWIIPTKNKALLTLLNSKMGWWLTSKKCPFIQGGRQLIWKQFCQIPIPPNLSENLSEIAEQILEARKNGIDTKVLENKADELVYDAYGLTDDERKVIDDFSEKEAAKRASNKN